VNEKIAHALKRDRTIDITTIGRKSGKPRRIEIWFYRAGDKVYLCGLPGRRSWYANLLANPKFTVHLKETVKADLAARAIPITDYDARREIMSEILIDMNRISDLEAWVRDSPLVEVAFEDSTETKTVNIGRAGNRPLRNLPLLRIHHRSSPVWTGLPLSTAGCRAATYPYPSGYGRCATTGRILMANVLQSLSGRRGRDRRQRYRARRRAAAHVRQQDRLVSGWRDRHRAPCRHRDEEMGIVLPNGDEVSAALVGRDQHRLAVLRQSSGLTAPAWVRSDALRVKLVLALGRLADCQATLSVVSAVGSSWRTGAGGQIDRYLQTDVVMYRFSGGPRSARPARCWSEHVRAVAA
jgi:deazaflavin-dependent oxidoreductase (nitroreductase family)